MDTRRGGAPKMAPLFTLSLLLLFAWVLVSCSCYWRSCLGIRSWKEGFSTQAHDDDDDDDEEVQKRIRPPAPAAERRWARRLIEGPGSYPPRCTSKCGECTPCKPVHVPVPPGMPVIAEYYPEAWRCKCNNKLYMP